MTAEVRDAATLSSIVMRSMYDKGRFGFWDTEEVDRFIERGERLARYDTVSSAFQADLILYVKQLPVLLERVSNKFDDLGGEIATLKKQIAVLEKNNAVLEKNNKTLQQRLDKSELVMKEGQCAVLLEKFLFYELQKTFKKIRLIGFPFARIVNPVRWYDDVVKRSGLDEKEFDTARRIWLNLSREVKWKDKYLDTYFMLKDLSFGPAHPCINVDEVESHVALVHPIEPNSPPQEQDEMRRTQDAVRDFVGLIRRIEKVKSRTN